ncbi:unnamed protein product [Pieris macdunnoughi]|uniref:Uncharacterized protein n=1 Tax=Pieris macdunnoughi TaxID=345717 RepID=A0A821TJ63_9NEOP|nr:unnamed protein product [Pieris macdunnoughi]
MSATELLRPLQIPPKVETEPSKVKRALVLPMRRCVDPQKIVIRVAADGRTDEAHRFVSSTRAKDEYSPIPLARGSRTRPHYSGDFCLTPSPSSATATASASRRGEIRAVVESM